METIEENSPVTERVKTFEDACKELGERHRLVKAYKKLCIASVLDKELMDDIGNDTIAYLMLRIICAALNEGWEPRFTENEYRYYPWFRLYTKDEVGKMDEEERNKIVMFSGSSRYGAYTGFAYAASYSGPSNACENIGYRLCLKNRELSFYCGNQFIDIWANYSLNKK